MYGNRRERERAPERERKKGKNRLLEHLKGIAGVKTLSLVLFNVNILSPNHLSLDKRNLAWHPSFPVPACPLPLSHSSSPLPFSPFPSLLLYLPFPFPLYTRSTPLLLFPPFVSLFLTLLSLSPPYFPHLSPCLFLPPRSSSPSLPFPSYPPPSPSFSFFSPPQLSFPLFLPTPF